MEVQKLRQTFHEIDADHTGTISFVEMAQACKRMNLDVDLESMMRTMDEDGDGVINYDEFTKVIIEEKATQFGQGGK